MTDKIEAAAFDQNLAEKVLGFLKPLSPIAAALDNVRKAADTGAELPTQWPLTSVYVATDALVSIYTQLKKMMAAQNGQTLEDPSSSNEMMDQYIVEPSIMSVLVPWEKTRTIVHIKNQNLPDDLLNTNAKILTQLPQWSTFFNVMDHNIVWDGSRIYAVAFARYFFGVNKAIGDIQECPSTVAGEPKSFVNNMICVFVDEHGNFILGPFLPISDQFTIADLAKQATNNIIENLKQEAAQGNLNADKLEQLSKDAADTLERTMLLFKFLIYFLQNQTNLKDSSGNPQSLPNNPQTVLDKNGAQIQSVQHTSILYLD